jgi:hypothetical protein
MNEGLWTGVAAGIASVFAISTLLALIESLRQFRKRMDRSKHREDLYGSKESANTSESSEKRHHAIL